MILCYVFIFLIHISVNKIKLFQIVKNTALRSWPRKKEGRKMTMVALFQMKELFMLHFRLLGEFPISFFKWYLISKINK